MNKRISLSAVGLLSLFAVASHHCAIAGATADAAVNAKIARAWERNFMAYSSREDKKRRGAAGTTSIGMDG